MTTDGTKIKSMFTIATFKKNWAISPLIILLGFASTMMTLTPIYTLGKPDVVTVDKNHPVLGHERAKEGRRWRFLSVKHGNPESGTFDPKLKELRAKLGAYEPMNRNR